MPVPVPSLSHPSEQRDPTATLVTLLGDPSLRLLLLPTALHPTSLRGNAGDQRDTRGLRGVVGSGGSKTLAWAVPDERGGTARPPRASREEGRGTAQ